MCAFIYTKRQMKNIKQIFIYNFIRPYIYVLYGPEAEIVSNK